MPLGAAIPLDVFLPDLDRTAIKGKVDWLLARRWLRYRESADDENAEGGE